MSYSSARISRSVQLLCSCVLFEGSVFSMPWGDANLSVMSYGWSALGSSAELLSGAVLLSENVAIVFHRVAWVDSRCHDSTIIYIYMYIYIYIYLFVLY